MAITRHGINRNGNGPLAQCSFEETVDILYRWAGWVTASQCPQGSHHQVLLTSSFIAPGEPLPLVTNVAPSDR
jgi:hypothetical protein